MIQKIIIPLEDYHTKAEPKNILDSVMACPPQNLKKESRFFTRGRVSLGRSKRPKEKAVARAQE
jgi:hypothetical protein